MQFKPYQQEQAMINSIKMSDYPFFPKDRVGATLYRSATRWNRKETRRWRARPSGVLPSPSG